MTDDLRPLPRPVLEAIARGVACRPVAPALRPPESVRHVPASLRVHVVCYEEFDAWILGKIARRLCEALRLLGTTVTLGKQQDPSCDINHHVVYFDYLEPKQTLETVMITHIDTERELAKVRRQLLGIGVEMGICMSRDSVERLAYFGIPRDRLAWIGPAHDGILTPRKTLIGLTTRLYPDGCKREHLLQELCERISPLEFAFTIMGSGWPRVIDAIRGRGFDVTYVEVFDYTAYNRLIPSLDFYLYLGQDEGSMGVLDALAAGVPTIVTPQGFHLDVRDGITHPFTTLAELSAIFETIAAAKRRRVSAVADLTWAEFARKHLFAWEYLLRRRSGAPIPAGLFQELTGLGIVPR